MKRYILMILALTLLAWGCVQITPEPKQSSAEATPVSMSMHRDHCVLNIDVVIPENDWSYTSVLSDDGMTYTLIVKGIHRKLGALSLIRPALSYSKTEYPLGFRIVIKLANRNGLQTIKNSVGLRIKLTAIEPDMEMYSMDTFGPWADPLIPAEKFDGSVKDSSRAVISFDSTPVYASGEAGGRYYLDLFHAHIEPGTVKYKGLIATTHPQGKTRLIFDHEVKFCPKDNTITLGTSCAGYSGLMGFKKDVKGKAESFQFLLPGSPKVHEENMNGLTAFGFSDTKLFSRVFQRYSSGQVYKVEARRKDGMLWLVFLYHGELKHRRYYSGDRFFVVFYK